MHEKMNNKGYFFKNYFDAVCYLIIAAMYPMLTLSVQSNQTIQDSMMEINFLISTLFFTMTFFYDYYQRFRDCEKQTKFVVNVLFWGNVGFAVITLLVFFAIVCIVANYFPNFKDEMMFIANKIWILAGYPALVAIYEIFKRLSNQRKRKICSIMV